MTDEDIERIGRGVEACTLPKPEWTHAAHWAAALWVLERGAHARMPALIRAYNEATGVANTDSSGYHETITLASLRAAHAMMRVSPGAPLHCVHAALAASELGRSDWPLRYWTGALLFSPEARRMWVEPDIAPLPYGEIAP